MTTAKPIRVSTRRRARPEARRKDGLLTTGDMARLSQNTLRTVRFYEEAGLIEPLQRTDGGHRLFPMRELRKLLWISDLRAAGFALEEIREMLELKCRQRSGSTASKQVVARLKEHVDLMNTRIALLKRLSAELEAARTHLTACTRCEDPALFPASCGNCVNMKCNGNLPDALGVLWGIDT
ncbi:MAG: MerR family transcriptional regulator [Sorangiineae bacterium PRO1]|nr:MerR family transcriptional regulator [Sorangiineae bacterium PRO1]